MRNKKILVILPKYLGYEDKIKTEIEKSGNEVFLIFENMDEVSWLYRFIYVYGKRYKRKVMDLYYQKKIDEFDKDFDIVFVIRGASLSEYVINYIKDKNPNAIFYMYQWDSVKNNPNALKIACLFKKVSTFDMEDAARYNWNYRPLFYYCGTKNNKTVKYDICFICSLHSQRIQVYNKLLEYRSNYREFLYLFSKRSHYYKQKYFKKSKNFDGLDNRQIKFKSLSLSKTQKIYSQSNIVVDYAHPGQNGFTMRTIESIGHKCKLITNNKNVLSADFYNPNNILLYNLDDFFIPKDFLDSGYTELENNIYDRYSISTWLRDVIDL